jgi:hypothetical protein
MVWLKPFLLFDYYPCSEEQGNEEQGNEEQGQSESRAIFPLSRKDDCWVLNWRNNKTLINQHCGQYVAHTLVASQFICLTIYLPHTLVASHFSCLTL